MSSTGDWLIASRLFHFKKKHIMKINGFSHRRKVAIDIETVPLALDDAQGALSAISGRIVCIGLLMEDGETTTESCLIDDSEAAILTQFWGALQPNDIIIGHNVANFDLPFIKQRSCIHRIRPSRKLDIRRFYSQDVIDTMQLWSNWGAQKFVDLDSLAQALGCGVKTAHGSDVTSWWQQRQFDLIARYCQNDVRLAYSVFCRLCYREIPEAINAERHLELQ